MEYKDDESLFNDCCNIYSDNVQNNEFFYTYDLDNKELSNADSNENSQTHLKEFYNIYGVPDDIVNAKEFLGKVKNNLYAFEFKSTLEYIESEFPLLIQYCPTIKSCLLSLSMFLSLSKGKTIESDAIFSQLEMFLAKYDIVFLRKKDYLKCLKLYPELFQSKEFIKKKIFYYIDSLVIVITNELNMLFLSNSNNASFENDEDTPVYKDYAVVRNIEDELMIFLSSHSDKESLKIHEGSLEMLNTNEFNYTNDLENRIAIQNFLQNNPRLEQLLNEQDLKHFHIRLSPLQMNEEKADYSKDLMIALANSKESVQSKKAKIFYLSKVNKCDVNVNNRKKPMELLNQGGVVVNCNGKTKSLKLNELKLFNFKTIKRENIDKKVVRKFRKYLKQKIKGCKENFSKFVKDFCKESLFPPFIFEGVSFKSFNASYMIWIFSNTDVNDYYEEYIQINIEALNLFLINTLKITDFNDKCLMLNYIKNIARIYSKYTDLLQSTSIYSPNNIIIPQDNSEFSNSIKEVLYVNKEITINEEERQESEDNLISIDG